MSRQFPSTLVAVSYSTRKTLVPGWMVQHIATVAGVDGLDIDATSRAGAWLASRSGESELHQLPVRTVWLAADDLRSSRNRRLLETLAENQPSAPPLVIAIVSCSPTMHDLIRSFEPVRHISQTFPVAVGFPSASLRGGRPHLVQLGGMRRFAEEWDLSVAIDLSGPFDPTWEAEAAIARLGERLSVLRVTAAAPSRAAVGRDRVACRALHAAIDRDRVLDIAIAPVKSVPFPITPRVASYGTRRAMEYITARAALHAQALREGISRYEGSSTSRGI